MISYRKILFSTVALCVILLAAIAAVIIVVDPAQHYHANPSYMGNQRMEIGGVAKHHDYDAAIFGSSMAMNHYPALADSLWGWKTMNFSIMGATDDDYSVIIPYVVKQGKLKNAIWSIDFFSFARQRGAVPEYLYDDNPFSDCKYLWNYSSLTAAIDMLRFGGAAEQSLYHFDSGASREAVMQDYKAHLVEGYSDPMGGGEVFDLPTMKRRFDESVFRIVKESPEVAWRIYFPPYSEKEFEIYALHGNLEANLEMRDYMAQRLLSLPNVQLYDFQCAPWITNLDEYMDLRHHSHAYNRAILRAIHAGDYRVSSPAGVAANSRALRTAAAKPASGSANNPRASAPIK